MKKKNWKKQNYTWYKCIIRNTRGRKFV